MRASHAAKEGQIFGADSDEQPGGEINCRCWGEWQITDKYDCGKPAEYGVFQISPNSIQINYPNGIVETRIGGSLSWRNNNPGNLRDGKFTRAHKSIGESKGFAVFKNEADGSAASRDLLKSNAYSNLTINHAIEKRSPGNENDTGRVQENIRTIGKFDGNEIVGDLSVEEMDRLLDAIQKTEGWLEGDVIK